MAGLENNQSSLKPLINVAAAAIVDRENRVLISKRARNTHQGGKWEFPGGKCEPGESLHDALNRELQEELGIQVERSEHLITLTHHYEEKSVKLSVWTVSTYSGVPTARENQPLRWKAISDLIPTAFPAADYGVIRALQLPRLCAITPDIGLQTSQNFLKDVENLMCSGIRLLVLRCHTLTKSSFLDLAEKTINLCHRYDAICMLDMPLEWLVGTANANLHLTGARLMQCSTKPVGFRGLLSASCHNEREVLQAVRIGADFILLSPVVTTASHPEAEPLGWTQFARLVDQASIPVYALGGLKRSDLDIARGCGAQGIAGISAFWKSLNHGGLGA